MAAPLPPHKDKVQNLHTVRYIIHKVGSSFSPDIKEEIDESMYHQPDFIYSQMACCPEWDDINVLDQVTVQVVLSYPVCLLQQL